MSEDKGGEYTKRLSQELKSSLYQRGQEDPHLWGNDQLPPQDLQVGQEPGPSSLILALSSAPL